ncbi:AAA family ATPase [uncultured Eubacterium sp.]|uniref:AAA family ATPase n=1 Tax=uncultured Eubacterium sp. TaxID=165185 RepID=UPI002598DE42|nr:AAA family ATPase [uncultured Eubacterium sp.]
MPKVISIGNQGFEDIRKENHFYVDKTEFIREWWESGDSITLITRPRRFGKTLNMDMLKCFFSNQYAERRDLFEGLTIWKAEKYRSIQGTYPVIYLSFADVKQTNYEDAVKKIKRILSDLYQQYIFLLQEDCMTEMQKKQFSEVSPQMDHVTAQCALQDLAHYLYQFYGKKVILLLDEYDTPMQEAYVYGYWKEFTAFIRSMFNSAFKTNPYLERAVMTGITRVSKESVFSDLNNLNVVTTTSEEYETCFGFTEQEVFAALDNFDLNEYKDQVKEWYDGFVFGKRKDIYNPWSITNFLDKKKFDAYWAATSSNNLVSRLIQTASPEIKEQMELLLQNKEIVVHFDEQIIFEQLDHNENAIWSLLLASGYLKSVEIEYRGLLREKWYYLQITNLETMGMFMAMFRGWFEVSNSVYNRFVKALLKGNVREMNAYMNEVALATFSNFDSGKHPSSKTQPERFYHGFVLGLLVELRDRYQVKSNRESGYGRYDVMLIPRNAADDAMILEFKVFDAEEENSLRDTVKSALHQIVERQYDAELLEAGLAQKQIHHYGFAFEGKNVLIDGQ